MDRCDKQKPWAGAWQSGERRVAVGANQLGQDRHLQLPTDLREWVDVGTLMVWIELEVLRLDWKNPLVVDYLHQHPDYRPKMMLSVLALAYLTQVYGSEEIVRACHSDRAFLLLCEGKPPFAQEVASFRRKNRIVLERIISRVLLRAVKERFDLAPEVLSPELEGDLRDRAVERLDIARHMDVGAD